MNTNFEPLFKAGSREQLIAAVTVAVDTLKGIWLSTALLRKVCAETLEQIELICSKPLGYRIPVSQEAYDAIRHVEEKDGHTIHIQGSHSDTEEWWGRADMEHCRSHGGKCAFRPEDEK